MKDIHRDTGRTTRMVAEAHRLARLHKAVYVYVSTRADVARVRQMVGPGPHGIKVEVIPPNFDWNNFRVPGAHSNCVFLVDHHGIEISFSRVLKELHRFDAEDQTPPNPSTLTCEQWEEQYDKASKAYQAAQEHKDESWRYYSAAIKARSEFRGNATKKGGKSCEK